MEALLAIAQQQFLRHGYAGTSVAEIARAAGIEPGSVYWYFRSKDDAFAAVMHRLLDGEVTRIEALDAPPTDRLLAALDAVEGRRSLEPCVHERAQYAPAVLAFHRRLHAWLHGLASDAVGELVGDEQRRLAADAVVATVEGALASPAEGRPASQLVRYVLLLLTRSREPAR